MSHDESTVLARLSTPFPDAVVRYGAHEAALVDVHLPAPRDARPDAPVPLLVVLLHGGFWKQAHDRRHSRAAAAALAAAGHVVATPEYRRVGGGGGWPTTAEDVETAVLAVPGLLAGLGVPTHGPALVGHSAGGQLALWLAARGHGLERVVALAPVGDLRAAARAGLGDGATQAFLGGEPAEVPDRYAAADPAVALGRAPAACPVTIVHGMDDEVVPVWLSEGLVAAHPWLELRAVSGAGHYDVIDPGASAWSAVAAAVSGTGERLEG